MKLEEILREVVDNYGPNEVAQATLVSEWVRTAWEAAYEAGKRDGIDSCPPTCGPSPNERT